MWQIHNRVQPVAASKTQVYRAMLKKGLEIFEQEITANGHDGLIPSSSAA